MIFHKAVGIFLGTHICSESKQTYNSKSSIPLVVNFSALLKRMSAARLLNFSAKLLYFKALKAPRMDVVLSGEERSTLQ
jgi:hypothetical protein